MNANVDKKTCIGCGLCETLCPVVFALKESVAEVVADPVPPQAEQACREAAESCPTAAITLTE